MIILKNKNMIDDPNRHYASEEHIRIQVVKIENNNSEELFNNYHGEMLAIVLQGKVIAKTEGEKHILEKGDQVLMVNSEPFRLLNYNNEEKSIIQMCWMPGPYECD